MTRDLKRVSCEANFVKTKLYETTGSRVLGILRARRIKIIRTGDQVPHRPQNISSRCDSSGDFCFVGVRRGLKGGASTQDGAS